ncbi:lipopolysaccharide biosynthesis protein [Lutibacter sp.]|uniref:lipopolysaccharide biosynthesis protein n=1 Tax=Lutibacter sp. TaxID=1925666 RepID=UPI0025BDE4E8|nr:lipopolysaccharide biosynthesis protein [Lutibacter sp.]
MILIILVTLYTSRVILNALGIEDYGLHNVVGGMVLMMSFLNNAMATSTQRFLNFEMGRGDIQKLNRVFSMSVNIHLIIAIVVFLLLETLGLWFVNSQLNIPPHRMEAVIWVFHFSAASLLITIAAVPYHASIIAHEKMTVFAYIGIAEALLKLLVAFLITRIEGDSLKVYALLLFGVTGIVQIMYYLYSRINFKESNYFFYWDTKLFKTLASFAGWSLFGSFSVVMKNQGVNVLLNIFFGPTVNAAKGISAQINGALSSFVQNFQTALKPQMIKSYAAGDIRYHLQLAFSGAKYSYFLLLFLSLPILLEMETILVFWLKNVPEFTTIFARLVVISALVDALSVTLVASIQATGKVKNYQIMIGSLFLVILPFSYLFFKLGFSPQSTYYVALVIFSIILVARLFLVKKQIDFAISDFLKFVFFKALIVTICSIFLPFLVIYYFEPGFLRFFIVVIASLVSTLFFTYFFGTEIEEKQKVKLIFHNKIKNIIK